MEKDSHSNLFSPNSTNTGQQLYKLLYYIVQPRIYTYICIQNDNIISLLYMYVLYVNCMHMHAWVSWLHIESSKHIYVYIRMFAWLYVYTYAHMHVCLLRCLYSIYVILYYVYIHILSLFQYFKVTWGGTHAVWDSKCERRSIIAAEVLLTVQL